MKPSRGARRKVRIHHADTLIVSHQRPLPGVSEVVLSLGCDCGHVIEAHMTSAEVTELLLNLGRLAADAGVPGVDYGSG